MYYLDNAATSWPKPEAVYQTHDAAFRQMFSPKRGTSAASRLGGEKLQEARKAIGTLLNIPEYERIAFTSGATHALNMAIQGFPWQPGDAAVISAVEHHAVSRPIRKMARERGIELHVVPYTDEVPFDLNAFETLLKTHPNIKMVATTHASNVIGSVMPIAEIARLTHHYGAVYLLDAAQSAGAIALDVAAHSIDMVALPGHKCLYGPPGVGALYVSSSVEHLNTFIEGGTGNDSGKHEMHVSSPEGIEVGTISMPAILSLAAGTQWVIDTGIEQIHALEHELLQQLMTGLESLPELQIYGHRHLADKTPVISFNLPGVQPKDLGNKLFDDYGIALRAGYHCAPMAHQAIGTLPLGGTVRASIGYTTKPEDVDALIHALKTEIPKYKTEGLLVG